VIDERLASRPQEWFADLAYDKTGKLLITKYVWVFELGRRLQITYFKFRNHEPVSRDVIAERVGQLLALSFPLTMIGSGEPALEATADHN
jgi:hypothetical protein